MNRRLRAVLLITGLVSLYPSRSRGQEDAAWRISPEKINIQAGSDRPLQVLDDTAQELRGAVWSVDNTNLAEIAEENGRATVHAKSAGTIRVSAVLGGQTRVREIRIWPADQPLPLGTTTWGMHPIGREIGDLAAVPVAGGTDTLSLEQTADGRTYLRAVSDVGIQDWAWLMPEKTRTVDLVCGDWLGGALVSANRGDSFTLYVVGQNGKLRWQRTLAGLRKAHAYNLDHLVHILSQSPDGTVARITGFDGVTGAQKLELPIPASSEHLNRVRRAGAKILCASGSTSSPARIPASDLFVSIDGFAYAAFTQSDWTLSAAACAPESELDPRTVTLARQQRLTLWQIHPDGTYRETLVEEVKASSLLSEPAPFPAPTGGMIPDGLGGVLLSVRWSQDAPVATAPRPSEEFVYRLDGDGKVVYRLLLPQYDGPRRDEMVLGENELGFATRGGVLIAFNVREGKETWRWDSHVPGIKVFAALAGGDCLVQTPEALVDVHDAAHSMVVVFKGQAMMNWKGQLFRKHE